jgi:hypothetical protein
MVSVLVSGAVDRALGDKTKDYKIGICCFYSKDDRDRMVAVPDLLLCLGVLKRDRAPLARGPIFLPKHFFTMDFRSVQV